MRTAQLSVLLLALLMLGVSTGCGKRGARPINTQDGDTDRVELLGTRKVDFKGDFDTIMVTLKEGTFHAIRVDVEGSAIEMWDIDVFFSNGGHEDFNTRLNFAEGSWSRRIDLRGGARGIKKVTFKYKSKKLKTGKATVKLYGIH
ncbi:MAG: hypothetical protein KDB90_13355 [Planctomycetes bacterium]|nr:hypothetical protein [Planctomycetota bacterium]